MSTLEISIIPILNDNYAYFLFCPQTKKGAVIDPGEGQSIMDWAHDHQRPIDMILATHHHGDHVAGVPHIVEKTQCHVMGYGGDAHRMDILTHPLKGSDTFLIGHSRCCVLEVFGHTMGHIAFWLPDEKALFCGDALFHLGCGALFEGQPQDMWLALKTLRDLPDDTRVYCGHEYSQSNARFALSIDPDNQDLLKQYEIICEKRQRSEPTVPFLLGDEKKINPFLRADCDHFKKVLGKALWNDVDFFAFLREEKNQFS